MRSGSLKINLYIYNRMEDVQTWKADIVFDDGDITILNTDHSATPIKMQSLGSYTVGDLVKVPDGNLVRIEYILKGSNLRSAVREYKYDRERKRKADVIRNQKKKEERIKRKEKEAELQSPVTT
jgi:hypothetical protein